MGISDLVFVSHTSDMAVYPPDRSFVQAAIDAILKAGLNPVEMTYFPAKDVMPAEYCQQRVRECGIYVAVVGFRYGSRVPDREDGISFTELEFLTATEAGILRLIFILDEDVPLPQRLVDRNRGKVDAFREHLYRSGVIVRVVRSPAELSEALLHALFEIRLSQLRASGGTNTNGARGLKEGESTRDDRERPWMAPPLDRIVERAELGTPLIAALLAPGTDEVALTTSLAGAGGFGKTTLATWACHNPEVKGRFPGGLLWVTVGQNVSGADLANRINDLAFILSGTRPAISEPDAAGAELGRLLDEQEPVLLVIDDIWDGTQLRPFRFGGRRCTRLVTTRIPNLLPLEAKLILIGAMSRKQARQLVADGVTGLPTDFEERLATSAGRWPVLLTLINGALRRRVAWGQSPEQAAREVMQLLAAKGPAALDPARPSDRSKAVAATVDASLALLDHDDQERYLDLAIFPEDVDIPLNVLSLLWPERQLEVLCEELIGLRLVADYRLDSPGPRITLHDVIRAYLRSRRRAEARAEVHRRLVDAAAKSLIGHHKGPYLPWWRMPTEFGYLWRFLPNHLREADRWKQLAALVCDLRWVEAKTRHFGSVVGVEADLDLLNTETYPTAAALRRILADAAPLLSPIDPPKALGATLASRVHGVPELQAVLGRYRASLSRPRLEPAWPLPDISVLTRPDGSAGHTGGVTSCAFSPDGRLLVTTSDDRTARLWRVADGSPQAILAGHTGGVWGCAFSPDCALVATVSDDRTVRLWEMTNGACSAVLIGHTDWVQSCAFSPDGTVLASVSNDGTARLWQVDDGICKAVLIGHGDRVTDCAFSIDGSLLATTGEDGTIRLWEMPGGGLRAALTGHIGRVWGCVFSPDGTMLASTGDDGTVRLWLLSDGTCKRVLTGHAGRVWGCVFSPDGARLASSGHDCKVRLWRVNDGSCESVMDGHTSWVRGCAFSCNGKLLASTSNDGTVRLWAMPGGTPHAVLIGQLSRVIGCTFSPDGALLATTSMDSTARLWSIQDGTYKTVLTGHTSRVNGCAFSPNGSCLATTSYDGTVRLWAIPSGISKAVLTGHSGWAFGCAFSPDGMLLATTGYDKTVRLWAMPTGNPRAVLIGHTDVVNGCAFSPDGALLATTGYDGTVRLWAMPAGTPEAVLIGHTDAVFGCAFSPDGALLATTSYDRTVRLWAMPTGTPHARLAGHTSWVRGCAFSADGKLLHTVSNDGTIRVWTADSSRCQCALRVASPLVGIALHPDKDLICASGGAGTYLLAYLRGCLKSRR